MDRLESMMAQSMNADAAGLDGEAFTARHGDTVSGRVRRKRRGRAAGGAVAGLGAVGAVALVAPMLGDLGPVPATPLVTPTSSEAACLTETVFDDVNHGGEWAEVEQWRNRETFDFRPFLATEWTGMTAEFDADGQPGPTFYIWDERRAAPLMSIRLDSAESATVTLADGTEMVVDPRADENGADEAVAIDWEGVGAFSIDFGDTDRRFNYRTVDPLQTADIRPADMVDATVSGPAPCGPAAESESPSPSPTKSSAPEPSLPTTPWPEVTPVPGSLVPSSD